MKISNQFRNLRNGIRNTSAVLAFFTGASSVFGGIIGSDTINPNGTVTYSYKVDNSTGSFDIAVFSLEFGFGGPDWNQFDDFTGGDVAVPNANWFADAGTPITGQSAQDFISLDAADDVAKGEMLTGFSFTSDLLPGTITYDEFSADGEYSKTGTTIGPVETAPESNGPFAWLSLAALAGYGIVSRSSRNGKNIIAAS